MPEPIQQFTATAAPLNRNNIDTDQIIPARFLKGTVKSGLGERAFYDWRYDGEGNPKADFSLNAPQYKGAGILVSGHNFGCGSSREHAPWALKDYGFHGVIAVSFADIFKNNALKNRVIPIPLDESVVFSLMSQVEQNPSLSITVNIEGQTVSWDGQPSLSFDIPAFSKACILQGVDDIGYTRQHLEKIQAYESTRTQEESQAHHGWNYLKPEYAGAKL